jgi:hypothetical protein
MMCANLQLTDYDADGQPVRDDLAQHSAALSDVLSMELDGACAALGLTGEEVLLAALGRAIDRTVGGGVVTVDLTGLGTSVHPVTLSCAGPSVVPATDMLATVHHAVAAVSLHRARHEFSDHDFSNHDALADVLLAVDDLTPGPAGFGHGLELHARRHDGVVVLEWWYDARSFEPYTIEELAEQFPLALIELTSEASAPILAGAELAMSY